MGKKKKILSLLIVLTLVFTLIPVNVQATSNIKLNKTRLTLYVGSTETLVVTGTTEKVTWKSSNKKVATVNENGKITAKKKGTTLVTANVSGKILKCKVSVKKTPKPKVVTINKKKELKVTKGQKYALSVTGTKAVSWRSSNKKVATISAKGELTAKKCGVSTVKVKCSNKKTYKCKVMVRPQNMSYGGSELFVAVNDKTFNYKTDFRNLVYDKEYYRVSFVRFVPEINKGGKKGIKYPTQFDITKPASYLAEYKFTPVTGEESVYLSRTITVIDDAEYVNNLDQK